jgi:DNA-binding response OmpR family regulator
VLNVEDHPSLRFARSQILDRHGWTSVEASSGAEARAQVRHGDINAVLLDIQLPDDNGFALCEAIKHARPDLPVVMITALYRTLQARHDAFSVGADAYLLEPVDESQLTRVIRSLLTGEALAAVDHTWITTDASGTILDISPRAAQLLNLSLRHVIGRDVLLFFPNHRSQLRSALREASGGLIAELDVRLRPRERKAVAIRLELTLNPETSSRPLVRWALTLLHTA